jgi:pimeloyl-ACP methyl ester carboxylesterase
VTMEDLRLELSSGTVHALRQGRSGAAPVICVPGLSTNARSFDLIGKALGEDGHEVIALDLRGRGLSRGGLPGSHGWERHAEDVLETARKLRFASFDLVGHSMGAFVVMQAAALRGGAIRRLVLIDAAGIPEPSVVPPILAGVQRLDTVYASREEYCATIQRRGMAVPWEELWKGHYLYELEDVPSGVRPRTSKAAVFEDAIYGSQHDAKAFWPSLTMPTLLVRAARPLLPDAGFVVGAALRDEFVAAVASAKAVDVDANHFGVMAHPEALRAISSFLTC